MVREVSTRSRVSGDGRLSGMDRKTFPFVAVALGLLLYLLLWRSGASNPEAGLSLPVLTLLFVAELGFFVTLAGVVAGGLRLLEEGFEAFLATVVAGCAILAGTLFITGLGLWRLVTLEAP